MQEDNLVQINFFSKRNNMAINRKKQSVEKVGDYFKETIGFRNKS